MSKSKVETKEERAVTRAPAAAPPEVIALPPPEVPAAPVPAPDPAKPFRDALAELLAAAPHDIATCPGLTPHSLARYHKARHVAAAVLGS